MHGLPQLGKSWLKKEKKLWYYVVSIIIWVLIIMVSYHMQKKLLYINPLEKLLYIVRIYIARSWRLVPTHDN